MGGTTFKSFHPHRYTEALTVYLCFSWIRFIYFEDFYKSVGNPVSMFEIIQRLSEYRGASPSTAGAAFE